MRAVHALVFGRQDFINREFPDELSLSQIEPFASRLDEQIRQLDEDIFEAIREQAIASKQTSKDVSDAKHAIEQLFGKIKDIKSTKN